MIRGSSRDELRRGGRRRSEEFGGDDFPFVRLGRSAIGTVHDVVQRVGDAIIGGDFGGNARGSTAIDIQIDRRDFSAPPVQDATRVASGDGAVLFGRRSRAAGDRSVALGINALADGDDGIALGGGTASGERSLAVGSAVASAVDTVGIGGQALASAQGAIAIGGIVEASAQAAIGIGDNETYATALAAIAVGSEARADGVRAVALGPVAGAEWDSEGDPVASGARSVAIGFEAYTPNDDEGVIAVTALKMQTSRTGSNPATFTYESIITTADTPTAGRLAKWTDADGIEDAGYAATDVARLSQANTFTLPFAIEDPSEATTSIKFENTDVTTRQVNFILKNAGREYSFRNSGNRFAIYDITDGAEYFTVRGTTGRIGIGTNAPEVLLHVQTTDTSITDFLILEGDRNAADTEIGILFVDRSVISGGQKVARIWTDRQASGGNFDLVFQAGDAGAAGLQNESIRIDGNHGRVGMNVALPTGQLHIDQSSTTAAIPVLKLDQGDISEGFVDFVAASAGDISNPITTRTAGNSIQGFVKMEVNGAKYWMPYYDAPTS